MDRQKVIDDTILAVQDTIHVLQVWRGLLETWRDQGQVAPDEFADAFRQLQEANLWHWARQAGGHGLEALANAVGVEEVQLNGRYREGINR